MSIFRQHDWADPSGSDTSVTKDFRDSPVENNILVAVVQAATTAANINTPSGWTQVSSAQLSTTNSNKVFVKRAGAAESKTVTVTLGASVQRRMHIYEIRDPGGSGAVGFAAATGKTQTGSPTTVTSNSVTPNTANSVALAALCFGSASPGIQHEWGDGFNPELGTLERDGWLRTASKVLTSTDALSTTATWTTGTNCSIHLIAIDLAEVPAQKWRRRISWFEGSTANTDGISTSPSFSVVSGRLLVAFLAQSKDGGASTTATLTDSSGDTWTRQVDFWRSGNARVVSIWTCVPSVTASRTVTYTTSTGESIWSHVIECSDRNTSNPIAQIAEGSDTPDSATEFTLSFADAPAASSIVVGMLLFGAVERVLRDDTPARHVNLAEGKMQDLGQTTHAQLYVGSDQGLKSTWTTSIHYAACAIELAAAAGGTTHERAVAFDAVSAIESVGQRDLIRASGIDALASLSVAGQRELLRASSIDALTQVSVAGQRELFRAVAINATADINASGSTGTENLRGRRGDVTTPGLRRGPVTAGSSREGID